MQAIPLSFGPALMRFWQTVAARALYLTESPGFGVIQPDDIRLTETDVLDAPAGTGGIGKVQHAICGLHQAGIFILTVAGPVTFAREALTPLQITDQGESQAAVLTERDSNRTAQPRPGGRSRLRTGRAGRIVGDGDAPALQLQCADGGIVVGQRGRNGDGPGVPVIRGFAAVNAVRLTAAHEGGQMTAVKFDYVGMNPAAALGQIHLMPGFSQIIPKRFRS